MLFADVVHYSQLSEEEIPLFYEHFIGAVAELIRHSPYAPSIRNTWGDAFFFVFEKVSSAGLFALDLRDRICSIDWAQKGLPKGLSLRIALHAGPVYASPGSPII